MKIANHWSENCFEITFYKSCQPCLSAPIWDGRIMPELVYNVWLVFPMA